MIEKNNVIHHPQIKRIVDYSEGDKQINILDQRFYKRNEEYYPSVTSILNYFPKNQYFHNWLKDVGYNSDIIMNKAAAEGTAVHNAVDDLLEGKELDWINGYGMINYDLNVWKMILKFQNFWSNVKPKLISKEYHVFSDNHKYAGTADLIVEINNEIWLIDVKTSNDLHTMYNLQVAAYVKAWNETHDVPITRTGILWLKAATRLESNKPDKIHGKGWQLKIIDNIDVNFEMFMKIYDIFKLENPDYKPQTEVLPTKVKL